MLLVIENDQEFFSSETLSEEKYKARLCPSSFLTLTGKHADILLQVKHVLHTNTSALLKDKKKTAKKEKGGGSLYQT